MIVINPANDLFQNVTKDRIEYIEFSVRDKIVDQLILMVMY